MDNDQELTQDPVEEQPTEDRTERTTQDPKDMVSRKAYAGVQTKLNKANDRITELEEQLSAIDEGKNKAEKLADTRLQSITTYQQKIDELEAELKPLKSQQLKVDAFQDLLGAEDGLELDADATLNLFNLLGDIPAGEDLDTTKSAILRFANFGKSMASQREQVLQEGSTPGFAGGKQGDAPQTLEDWEKEMTNVPPGDPKWKQFWNFVNQE